MKNCLPHTNPIYNSREGIEYCYSITCLKRENTVGGITSTDKSIAILKSSQANTESSLQISKPGNNFLWLSALPSRLLVLLSFITKGSIYLQLSSFLHLLLAGRIQGESFFFFSFSTSFCTVFRPFHQVVMFPHR